ncbi:MAG TPA: lysine--tRNA ligase [Thermoleophilia bacterium]|nr:lysine--tRNA ligase [Thermoleophilia bacterium]
MPSTPHLSELERERRSKADRLSSAGVELFARRFYPRSSAHEVLSTHADLVAGESAEDAVYRVAGRVMARREHGKAAFLTLRDGWDDLQVYANVNTVGQESFDLLTGLDLGDIIGVKGHAFCTRRGELSLFVSEWTLLTKSFHAPPEKWHGLQDKETRYRQRYADLLSNPEVGRQLTARGAIVGAMRRYLYERGFLEVETPILQPLPGGALARPFATHHNALDVELYLRIAPELYLKRLLVGGYDKVFEIGKNFRNEGISPIHNPEFTMMELYWAYVDYREIMELVEEMIPAVAQEVLGSTMITVDGREIDLRGPWPRRTVDELVRGAIGMGLADIRADTEAARSVLRVKGVDVEGRDTFSSLVDKTLKHLVWPSVIEPTFVIDHPLELSPLAKVHPDDPSLVERFQPIIAGREVGNAFSELNDPRDQRRRFEAQALNKAAGDEEAMVLDEDFLRALEYGMPPAGGLGIGIDRLAMLLLGAESIRDVILFPQLRPE